MHEEGQPARSGHMLQGMGTLLEHSLWFSENQHISKGLAKQDQLSRLPRHLWEGHDMRNAL